MWFVRLHPAFGPLLSHTILRSYKTNKTFKRGLNILRFFKRSNIRTDADVTEELAHQLLQTYMEAHLPIASMNNAFFLDSQISSYFTYHLSLLARTWAVFQYATAACNGLRLRDRELDTETFKHTLINKYPLGRIFNFINNL